MKNIKWHLIICIICAVCQLIFADIHSEDIDLIKQINHQGTKGIQSKGIFDLFYSSTDVIKNEVCSNDMKFYLQELSKITPWALQMFDASAKLSSGLLDGNLRHLGHFDECLNIEVESQEATEKSDDNTNTGHIHQRFTGQYCLVTVNLDLKDGSPSSEVVGKKFLLKNIDSAINKMMLGRRELEDRKKKRESQDHMPLIPIFTLNQWAICIPSTCLHQEIEIYVQHLINILIPEEDYMLNITSHIQNEACVSHSNWHSSNMERWISDNPFMWFFFFLVIVSVAGTCIDCFPSTEAEKEKLCRLNLSKFPGRNILLSFSIPANIKKIVGSGSATSRNQSTSLDCLDGVRFLSAIWVTLTHKILLLTREPFLDKGHLKESIASLFWMPLTANMMSVDSFLLLGGLLRGYNYAKDLDQGKSNQISSFIQRYLRLTPALAVIVWFYATTLHRIYYGPEWEGYVTSASTDCKESWLLNFLYVNNYLGFPRLCIVQSWYLSADMQLFIISPILLYPLWYTHKHKDGTQKYLGVIPLIFTLMACMATQFITTYSNGYPALYRVGSEDQSLLEYIQYIHMSTHTRMGPYVVGLMIGFVLNNFRGKGVTLSKLEVICGWTLSFTLFIYVLYGPYDTLQIGTPLRPLSDSIYASTHRIAWGIALGWLVFACCQGYAGPINQLLSANIFKQLSNLAYCIFLVHFAVLLTNLGAKRSSDYKDQYILVREFIADVVVTIVLSTILYLLVEAPFSSLTSIIFKKGKITDKKQDNVDELEKRKHQ